ncbi:MAG: hypothetical protein CME90_20555 [Hoeflea sp.]|nr:hypothetical protein [Hoeflea sp.]
MVAIVGFDLELVRNVSTVMPCPKIVSHRPMRQLLEMLPFAAQLILTIFSQLSRARLSLRLDGEFFLVHRQTSEHQNIPHAR